MKVDNLDCHASSSSNICQEKPGLSPLEDGDKTRFYFEKLINLEHSLTTIVAVNISLMVIYSSHAFNYHSKSTLFLEIILYAILGCAALQIIISTSRAKCKLELKKEQRLLHFNEGIISSGRIYYLIGESLLFLLQPSPFLKEFKITLQSPINDSNEYQFYINQILCLLCLLRVYVFIRALLTRTSYMNPRSHRLCRLHGCQASYQYALKCLFKDSPLSLILFGFGASLFIFGFAIQVCERPLVRVQPLSMNLSLFQNAMWLTIETMTTVGFGDFYPYTPFGRVIVLFIVVWGIFIVPIMVVVITNTLQMEKAEKRSLVVLNRLRKSQQVKQCAAQFIASVLKARKQTNEYKLQQTKKQILRLKQKFKKKNIELKGLQNHDDTYQQMSSRFQQLNQDIKVLNTNQEELINYIHNNFQYEPDKNQA